MADETEKLDPYPKNAVLVFMGHRTAGFAGERVWEEWGEVNFSVCPPSVGKTWTIVRAPKSKRHFYLAVGGLYDAHLSGETARWKELKPHGYLDDQRRTEWDALDRATRQSVEAYKRMEKEDRNWIRETLKPLRTAYHGLGGPQKAQLIADVVRYIVS